MTVPSTPRRAGPFYGTGSLVSYPFGFKTFDKTHIRVVIADSLGIESDLVTDSTVLVTLNADQDASPGGSVQYAISGSAAALPSGYTLAILSNLGYSQETDLPEGGNYRATAVEDGLDALEVQIQQLAELSDRTFTVSPLAGDVSALLPVPEAGKVLGWNLAENALVNLTAGGGGGTDLPTIAGQAGKYLTNDGTDLSWGTPSGSGAGGYGVSVFSYLSAGEIADVQSGALSIDLASKIQTAIDAVKAVGGALYFPRGRYLVGAPLVLDYSADTADPTQGTTNRIALIGDGAGATQIEASHGGALIDHRGGVGGSAGVHSFFYLEGLSLYNTTPRQAGSIAVKMDNTSLWAFKDISILGFEYGVKGTDVLSGHWTGGRLWSCTYGFRFEYVDFSRPNAISFRSVAVAGNRRYGGYVLGGALFSMYGGSVEGNGIDANGLADGHATRALCWGLKFEDSGVEGVVGATIHGGYFEGNSGKADIWISQLANLCTHSITGSSFLRFSATQYTVNNILYDNNPTTIGCRITVAGCGFRSQSPYTASSSRYYIGAQVGKVFEGAGNYYESITTELDRAVFAPLPLPRIPTANYPTDVSNYTGGLFWHPTLKRLMVGGDSKFQFASDGAYEVYTTDNAPTIVYMTNQPVFVWASTMAANRNLTLSVSNAYVGARWTIHRKVGGAYALSIYSSGTGILSAVLRSDGDWAEFQFDGTSWILLKTGTVIVGDTPTKSLVRASRNTTQDIGQNVDTTIIFSSEEFDTLAEYDSSTGVFTPKHSGYYRITATASTNAFAWVAGTSFFLRLMLNGSVYAVGQRDYKQSSATAQGSSSISTVVYVPSGNTLAVAGRTDRTPDADANNISASSISNHISIERVG